VEKAHISALDQRNWTIPTPIPMFLGSPSTKELVPRLYMVDLGPGPN